MNAMSKRTPTRDSVFTAAGQPSVTYVDRDHLKIEDTVRRAIRLPHQIVSLAGPSKSGKTVLCRKVLLKDQYVWIEGGQVNSNKDVWDKVCYELNYPKTIIKTAKSETKAGVSAKLKFVVSVDGSHLRTWESGQSYEIDSMATAIRHLIEQNIALVIDDFHYLPSETRKTFLRNIKGPVFNGLKVILLSVTHRGNDAVKSENELQGRVTAVNVPDWGRGDLQQIAEKGFGELNIKCPMHIVSRLAEESQKSPSLMQKLCWEICVGIGVDQRPEKPAILASKYDFVPMCKRVAMEAGHPVYQKLEVGPQSRKARLKRRLKSGGTADIYRAILMAIAATGPSQIIKYDDLRAKLSEILLDDAPQKHEITSALIHLRKISQDIGNDSGIDWDEEERKVDISDPYLRFYLRWQVRPISAVMSDGGALVKSAWRHLVLRSDKERVYRVFIPKVVSKSNSDEE